MRVFAVNGSPRHDGNTFQMLDTVLKVCRKAGFETEVFQAGGRMVHGCKSCDKCAEKPGRCDTDDWVMEIYAKMKQADAVILGSPTYYTNITTEMKAVIDRCGYVARRDGNPLHRKIGAAVAPARRAGGVHAIDAMTHFFFINGMIVPGSIYWNMSICHDVGDYEFDDEGVETAYRLGKNVVWLLEKLK